ncbi:MAG: restriction endonuclease subunit S [Fimbriimonadaceae bacterium]|nr:restriction endonuclease subunit S [Fimbriimonadaceae bacterium]
MMWPTYRLGDLLSVKHGWAFKGEHFADEGEYVLLTPGNFHENGGLRLREEKLKYYAADFPPEYLLQKGDLLVAMTDLKQSAPILGASARVPEDGRFLHNQRLGLIRVEDYSRLDIRYAYHIFNCPAIRAQIRATATGATVRHTAPERIYACSIRLPDLTTQARIAETLDGYDGLIANNLRRMSLLEEANRVIYREWFVSLNFPGRERVKITDGVPTGWMRSTLGRLVELRRDMVDPSAVDASTPYVGLEHIPRRFMVLDAWSSVEDVTSSKLKFSHRDILFGKIRPYLHKAASVPISGVCSSDAIVMRPVKSSLFSIVLGLVASDEFVEMTHQTSTEGSKMPRAHWPSMAAHPVLIPPNLLCDEFNDLVSAHVALIENLIFQNRLLIEARDLLLPRLMNGSISP